MRSSSLKFEIGKEFDETTPDGRQVKAIVTKVITFPKLKRHSLASLIL